MGFTAIPWSDRFFEVNPEDACCTHAVDVFRVVVEDQDGNRWAGRKTVARKDIDSAVAKVQEALDSGKLDPTVGNPMTPAYGSKAYQANARVYEAELDMLDKETEEFWGPRIAFRANHRGI